MKIFLFSWCDYTLQLLFPSPAVKVHLVLQLNLKVNEILIAIAHMKGQAMSGLSDQYFFLEKC